MAGEGRNISDYGYGYAHVQSLEMVSPIIFKKYKCKTLRLIMLISCSLSILFSHLMRLF